MDKQWLTDVPAFDRSSGLPAHVQIERWIVAAINRGEIVPGDKFPGERELASRFGVSRMTLRQAFSALEQRGLLVRTTGRAGGAVVVEPKIECDLTGLAGFTEQMRKAHLRAGAKVLSARTVPANRGVAAALRVLPEEPVHEVVRIRLADSIPLALERSYFPAMIFPDLLQRRLTGSLYSLLGKHYGQRPYSAVESLEPILLADDEATMLGVAVDTPHMLIQRTTYSRAAVPVEFARDIFRADRVRVTVRSGVSGEENKPT